MMKKLLTTIYFPILLIIAFSCDVNSIDPEIGKWQNIGLDIKPVTELKIFDNYLYACAGKHGLYRLNLSQSKSEWKYLEFADSTFDNPNSLTLVKISSTNELLLGLDAGGQSNNGLIRSSDNGLTWVKPENTLRADIHSLYVHPSSDNIIYAGLYSRIVKSTDYGFTWKPVYGSNGGFDIGTFRAANTKPSEIWAGGSTARFAPYILHSIDYGESWESAGQYFARVSTYDIAIDPTNEDILYFGMFGIVKTIDKGKSFKVILEPETTNNNISMNPNNPHELFTTGNYLYWTKDGGSSWQKIDPPQKTIIALAVNWQQRVLYVSEYNHHFDTYGVYSMRF